MKSGLPVGIDLLLDPSRIEGLRVEYKPDWNHVSGGEALRTMCAFANDLLSVNGGYVLFGVEERNGHPVRPVRGIVPEHLDTFQKQILNATHRIEPRYPPVITVEGVDGAQVIAVWCPAGDARPYTAPETLAKGSPRVAWVRTSSATQEAKGELLRRLYEGARRTPFDDRAALDASLDDLSPALLHAHVVQTHSRLATERLDVPALCRRLNLSRQPNGHEVPRNVALLFFSDAPTRWFPCARIELSAFPEGRDGPILRQTFEGPLPAQVRAALDALRGRIAERVDKVADRAEARTARAWPFEAVEEAVVNAVYHRGYDSPEPVKIEVLPDELRITSYPGPVDGVTAEALETGDFPAVPARNRRIAELLRELGLAEAARTGVVHIRSTMHANGSPPPRFLFDEARTFFEVRLPVHPAFRPEPKVVGQPLRIGRPAPPAEVVGREELTARVLGVLDRQCVALYGPVGRGVSSVLGAVAAAASSEWATVSVDAAGLSAVGAAIDAWLDDLGVPPASPLISRLETVGRRVLVVIDEPFATPDAEEADALARFVIDAASSERVRVLVGLRGPAEEPWDLREEWGRRLWRMAVPPLSAAAALTLTERLLLGARGQPDRAAEIAELSAGIPGLLAQLVHRHLVDPRVRPGEALDALLAVPGDPTGLAARLDLVAGSLKRSYTALTDVERTLLAELAVRSLTRADVVARATRVASRLETLRALADLELTGWVVEDEGRLRLEHPMIATEWQRAG